MTEIKKFARTISGVTPVAVMSKPMGCPGACVYCPTYAATPQSYTPESPAVIRAIRCEYSAKAQIKVRLRVLAEMGHATDKVELIIMGGTFPAAPVDYQRQFVKDCYDALNEVESATLEEAQRTNETTEHRCVGLCIETRPDFCNEAQVELMLEFGATRVELGVQMLDDEIYRLIRRGHMVEDVIRATALLKRHAFKVYYHWMPGLPGSTPEKDLALSKKLFEDERFRPDGLKLYPTVVVQGTEMEKWYQEGRYTPYDAMTMVNLLADIKSIVPKYVRIARVLRDIPAQYITAGCKYSLRSQVAERLKEKSLECRCIRCREVGHRAQQKQNIGRPHLARLDYKASGGLEIFLSFEDDCETLFGLLRLRIQDGNNALIRELHVFGPEMGLGERSDGAAQHKGLGKSLLREAEHIAHEEFGSKKISVLSGVGARDYYRLDSYDLRGHYMVKKFQS